MKHILSRLFGTRRPSDHDLVRLLTDIKDAVDERRLLHWDATVGPRIECTVGDVVKVTLSVEIRAL